MKDTDKMQNGTRERLLQAAGEVFAELGYRAATVREISRRADANVAAINYHFRDKEGLYSEVLKYTQHSADQRYPLVSGNTINATAEEQLHDFIRAMLFRILDEGRPAWYGKLISMEIMEPTAALDRLVEESIRPIHLRLRSIVRQFLGEGASEEHVRLCCLSIMAQCVFYHHSRSIIERLHSTRLGPGDIEQLASHIAKFSAGALKGMLTTGGSA